MVERNADYYSTHAPTVNLENVTSSDDNAIILQKLRDNDPDLTRLYIEQEFFEDPSCEFVVTEGDDLGWLGYFLGGNTTLTELHIEYLSEEKWRIIAFIRELVSNRSIQKLRVSTDLGDGFHSLGDLLMKSDTLVSLEFNSTGHNFDTIELQCARNIAIMLGQQNQYNHLTSLMFEDIDISGEAMSEIATALTAHPQLEVLGLWYEVFDEEVLHALVAGMRNCRNLIKLNLGWNSITTNGCRLLPTLFQSDNYCLKHLRLNIDNIDGYCAVDDVLSALAPAIGSLQLLETLSLPYNWIGNDGARALAPGLANLSLLEELTLQYNSIGVEGASALAAGLTDLRSLKKLDLSGNFIGNDGISALAPALASIQSFEELYLSNNSIGDDGVQALIEGISHCSKLSKLRLNGNRSITALGVVPLSTLLRSDGCSLTEISLCGIRIGNDGAAALADGLKGKKLIELSFNLDSAGLTPAGWSAFSKLLCDTSSVNNTYLSNHTLKTIGNFDNRGAPDDVKQLLALNKHPNEHVAIHKILMSHPDFDVESMLQWNLKALPLIVSWFERVITLVHVDDHDWISEESVEAIQSRKLSTMYKFIRGLPHMTNRSRKNATKFAFLRRKISNRCLSHLLNGMALRLRVKNAHTNRNA